MIQMKVLLLHYRRRRKSPKRRNPKKSQLRKTLKTRVQVRHHLLRAMGRAQRSRERRRRGMQPLVLLLEDLINHDAYMVIEGKQLRAT
jgi:hypothetical protein